MANTKLATKTLRTQHWAEIIHDCKNSGLTVLQYCQEHGLSKNAYFYWLKRVKAAALESAGIDFVELPVPNDEKNKQSTDFDTEAIVTVGKVDIRINSHTSKALLAQILEVASDVK